VSEIGLLAGSFMAGLLGSPHCLGMCGPFALVCGRGAAGGAAYHGGRLTTYAVLGALAGAFGDIIPGPSWIAAVVSLGVVAWFAGTLAGLVPEPRLSVPGAARVMTWATQQRGLGSRFVLGAANGLLPCGLVYAALGIPLAGGSVALGAAAMVLFGLGTVPVLVALTLGARQLRGMRLRVRRALAAGVLLAAVWSVGRRAGWIGGGQAHSPDSPDVPAMPRDHEAHGSPRPE
jgi:hypothetical protein